MAVHQDKTGRACDNVTVLHVVILQSDSFLNINIRIVQAAACIFKVTDPAVIVCRRQVVGDPHHFHLVA